VKIDKRFSIPRHNLLAVPQVLGEFTVFMQKFLQNSIILQCTRNARASLSVFSKCKIAFCTPEELRGGFIASSGLHLPDEG